MAQTNIALPLPEIEAFCARDNGHRLSLFGSVLHEDFSDESDVDFLVESMPDQGPSMFGIIELQHQLCELIGRWVDRRTLAELSKYFLQRVLEAAEVLYVHR